MRRNGNFSKFGSVFNPGAWGGDSVVMLESPKLELSSSVLLQSPSHMSRTLFGEGLSLLALSIWSLLPTSAVFLQIST